MTRVLLLIAFVGFVVAVACLGTASAIGGRELAEHGWRLPHSWHVNVDDDHWDDHWGDHWRRRHSDDNDGGSADGGGPPATRQIAWSGGEALTIDVPAEVRFTQASGPGGLTISGPKGSVDHLVLDGGALRFDEDLDGPERLVIVMTAPKVTDFQVNGSGKLVIAGYAQDTLHVHLNGSADVSAQGHARSAEVDVAGSGEVDLGQLAADSERVGIAGSGRAVIAPKAAADIDVAGSGEVNLLTHPASLRSQVSGSGRITQSGEATAAR